MVAKAEALEPFVFEEEYTDKKVRELDMLKDTGATSFFYVDMRQWLTPTSSRQLNGIVDNIGIHQHKWKLAKWMKEV